MRFFLLLIGMCALLACQVTVAAADESLRISDIAGKGTLVYPSGPKITVANPSGVAKVEVWVIRELDGAIVNKYMVSTAPFWKQTIAVKPPGTDLGLGVLVTGKNAELLYRLFLINPQREVKSIHPFSVRLSAPPSAPTQQITSQPWEGYPSVAAGTLQAINGNELSVRGWEDVPPITATSSSDTRVAKADGTNLWKWVDVKGNFKVGDQITMVYVQAEGMKHVNQVVVSAQRLPWDSKFSPEVDPWSHLHYQIGTIVIAKANHTATSSNMTLKTQNANREWLLGTDTHITKGLAEGKSTDLAPGSLVAVGTVEPSGAGHVAAHIILLKDLSETVPP